MRRCEALSAGDALPPTAVLPRLRAEPPIDELEDALRYLEAVYVPLAGEDDALDPLRADPTERRFALDWLAKATMSQLAWAGPEGVRAADHAARILAQCSSALEAGELVREFHFPMAKEGRFAVAMSVRDAPLPPSDSNSRQGAAEAAAAVGVQTYASSVIMCDLLVADPSAFHAALGSTEAKIPVPFRVVELGAGTGIVGMVAAKLLALPGCVPGDAPAEVAITDYHADVMHNLVYNMDTYLELPPGRVTARAEVLDWRVPHRVRDPAFTDAPADAVPPPHTESLVLAADVIYDPRHALWLVSAIRHMLRQPDTDPDARAHVLVPKRNGYRLVGLYKTLDYAVHDASKEPWNGYALVCSAQRTMPRRPGLGRQDEMEYVWTELRWQRVEA